MPYKHGFYARGAIVRDLLSEDEKTAWDLAELPEPICPHLDTVFRELSVMRYRIHTWFAEERAIRGDCVPQLRTSVDLLDRVVGKVLRALEVHLLISPPGTPTQTSERMLHYPRQLPAESLVEPLVALTDNSVLEPSQRTWSCHTA